MNETNKIKIEKKILEKNETIASNNRRLIHSKGAICLNLISSPGSGKTFLLERTLEILSNKIKCGVIVGDQLTSLDADRLSGKGATVRQIETGNTCHLEALQVSPLLEEVLSNGEKILFIENIGNLICPAAFDLGEDHKIGLLSVTEGEEKPLKYPSLFSRVNTFVITKTDLSKYTGWNRDLCIQNIFRVSPSAKIIETSAKTGEGLNAWINWLEEHLNEPHETVARAQ